MLNDYGYSSISFGIFMFLSAGCEIPALIVSRKFIARFGLIRTLFFCIAASIVETLFYAFGTSIVHVYIGQIIKGLSLGMSTACSIQLIYRLAHKGLETTTQAMIGSVGSIVTIVVAAFGGYALEAMGLRSFFGLISLLQVLAGSVLLIGITLGLTVLKKKLPEGV
jgi:MFS family permease